MKKGIFLISILLPTVLFAYTSPDNFAGFDQKSVPQKSSELTKYILMEQQRRDLLVAACLQSYAEPGRSYNEEWHQQIEMEAIKCAYRILDKLTAIDNKK